jgi:mono/diheme cytochrome c family protein
MQRVQAAHVAAVLLALLLAPVPTLAQIDSDFGRREYMSRCAVCHGVEGKGNGPLYASGFLAKPPTNLTILAANNGGRFPLQRVFEIIDGRLSIPAHGPRDMPVWGDVYLLEGAPRDSFGAFDPEVHVRARILALTDYLARIQVR